MSIVLEFILVPTTLYIVGMICIRLLGKKALAEMTGFEIFAIFCVNDMIIGPLIQDHWSKAVYYAFFFTMLYLFFTRLKNTTKLHHLFVPSPTVLIRSGDILEKGLKRTKITTPELLAMLRAKGYLSPVDVEMATLEEIGQLSILPKSNKRPIEPEDLGLSTTPTFVSIPVIIDGKVLDHNLDFLKLSRDWLNKQLTAAGKGNTPPIQDITLAAYTLDGLLQIDMKKENVPQSKYTYMPGNDN